MVIWVHIIVKADGEWMSGAFCYCMVLKSNDMIYQ